MPPLTGVERKGHLCLLDIADRAAAATATLEALHASTGRVGNSAR